MTTIVDRYTGVYLRTSKIRAFTLLICHTRLLSFPSVTLSRFQLPLPAVGFLLVWEDQCLHSVSLHCAAAGSYQSWGSPGKVPGRSQATFSMHLSDIWDLHLLLRSFLQQGFSPSFQATSCSLKLLLLFDNSYFLCLLFFPESPVSGFADVNNLYAETQCLFSVLAGGSVSCLFIKQGIQEVPLLFSPSDTKISN